MRIWVNGQCAQYRRPLSVKELLDDFQRSVPASWESSNSYFQTSVFYFLGILTPPGVLSDKGVRVCICGHLCERYWGRDVFCPKCCACEKIIYCDVCVYRKKL